MKLSIFSRLVIGFLSIFLLAMTVSVYAIAQLRMLEDVSRSIRSVDNRIMEYEKQLADVLLSMMRYEKKYVIIKDEAIYKQFLQSRLDFEKKLEETMAVADTEEVRDQLKNTDQLHKRYQVLFDEEVRSLRSGEQYDEKAYQQEKEYAVNGIMEALKKIEDYTQTNTYKKINRLNEANVNASKVAIVIGVASLVFGLIISIFITLNITRPLLKIKKKTREIADGDFGQDLYISSPPEINELARSFNAMCARLKEVEKMKADFFALMSHELRTPLTTIREGTNLYMEGLKENEATTKQKRLLTIINEECNRLIDLVNSLLDLSKMEAGMMSYNFSRTHIAPLIHKITGEMEPLAESKRIRLESDISSHLPQVEIDVERVLQALRNLIGNALKFSPREGHVCVYASSNGEGVRVSVSDTGPGISQEKVETIFDKYQQLAYTNSSKIKGTGLGLSIVRQIINAHGGSVWVESTSERGNTFTFILPS